jgi:hypothetical protein
VKGVRLTTGPGAAYSQDGLRAIVCAHAAADGSIRADQIAGLIADIEQRFLAVTKRRRM